MFDEHEDGDFFVDVTNEKTREQISELLGFEHGVWAAEMRECGWKERRLLRRLTEDQFGELLDLLEEGAPFKAFIRQEQFILPALVAAH